MTQENRIRVVVVDDHPIVQDGLRLLVQLSAGLEWVGQAGCGEDALALCTETQPDVILMDLLMPGMGGIEAIKAIRQRHSKMQVLALTSFAEPDLVQQALKAGAIGYVLKNVPAAALADAIRAAHSRQSVMAPEATAALVQAMQRNSLDVDPLTERELAVLRLVADGLTNGQIASRLSIAESTVRFHIGHIFLKLGAHNRAEAVRLAIEANLIPRQRTGD
jgi:two-component system, NarL family, response regulator LiaR